MENIVPPSGPLFIRVSKKGRIMTGRGTICHWLIWDSFLWVIDREAGTRMSGHDWTDLIS